MLDSFLMMKSGKWKKQSLFLSLKQQCILLRLRWVVFWKDMRRKIHKGTSPFWTVFILQKRDSIESSWRRMKNNLLHKLYTIFHSNTLDYSFGLITTCLTTRCLHISILIYRWETTKFFCKWQRIHSQRMVFTFLIHTI